VPTWCRVLHVNVTAAFALTQVLLPALKKSADASVVFTASAVGRQGRAYWGAYAVSKFAVEGLSQVLSAELEGISRVRVNALNPGRTRTAMRRQAYPAEDIETLPLPQALTGPYLALLGPASRGVSGRSFDAQPSPVESASSARTSDVGLFFTFKRGGWPWSRRCWRYSTWGGRVHTCTLTGISPT